MVRLSVLAVEGAVGVEVAALLGGAALLAGELELVGAVEDDLVVGATPLLISTQRPSLDAQVGLDADRLVRVRRDRAGRRRGRCRP